MTKGSSSAGEGQNHATTAVRYRHAAIGQIRRAVIERVEDYIQVHVQNDIQDRG